MTQYKQGQIIEITVLNDYGKHETYKCKVLNIYGDIIQVEKENSILYNILEKYIVYLCVLLVVLVLKYFNN